MLAHLFYLGEKFKVNSILCVALRHKETGEIIWAHAPARHHHLFRMIPDSVPSSEFSKYEQGFLDINDKFVDRKEAKKIARAADQLLDRASTLDILFSEDLW